MTLSFGSMVILSHINFFFSPYLFIFARTALAREKTKRADATDTTAAVTSRDLVGVQNDNHGVFVGVGVGLSVGVGVGVGVGVCVGVGVGVGVSVGVDVDVGVHIIKMPVCVAYQDSIGSYTKKVSLSIVSGCVSKS